MPPLPPGPQPPDDLASQPATEPLAQPITNDPNNRNGPNDRDACFTVVGIGASAGGLEAFTQLITHLPPDTGMAVVLVQHLDPSQGSLLSDIIARTTSMPVQAVTDGIAIAPNQVYVIPPNTLLDIEDGRLRLRPRDPAQRVLGLRETPKRCPSSR